MNTILPKRKDVQYIVNDQTGSFWYRRNYIQGQEFFHSLLNQSEPENENDDSAFWKMRSGELYGKKFILKRMLRQMGDNNTGNIQYGGKSHPISKWTPEIHRLRIHLMKEFNVFLDFCLLNYYRDGSDKIDPHPDRESLGPRNITIGISLGSQRNFILHRAIDGKADSRLKATGQEISLGDYSYRSCASEKYCRINFKNLDGDIYCMEGNFHKNWVHSIPEQKNVNKPRISLTFRQVLSDNDYRRYGLDTKNIRQMLEYLSKIEKDILETEYTQIAEIKYTISIAEIMKQRRQQNESNEKKASEKKKIKILKEEEYSIDSKGNYLILDKIREESLKDFY